MDSKVSSVKTNMSSVLKEFIIEKYGSISKFTRKEKLPRGDVEVILHKADIFNEMNIGMKVCRALRIDAEELFCRGNIKTSDIPPVSSVLPVPSVFPNFPDLSDLSNLSDLSDFPKYASASSTSSTSSDSSPPNANSSTMRENLPPDEIIREKCLTLGGAEQRKILDYINSILEN